MRILLLHNYYKVRGGEDVVFESEVELLRKSGYEVHTLTVRNDDLIGFIGGIRAALGVIFSLRWFLRVYRLLRNIRPDVVHVHNFFPQLSPSVFYACRLARVPVAMTLHNYRLICPTALLMHDGRVTEESIVSGPWWALRHRTYRNSYAATLALSLMISFHRSIGTWRHSVDGFIALTEFAKCKFIEWGISSARIAVKSNFCPTEASELAVSAPNSVKEGFLFVGRLSPEKGVDILLKAGALIGSRGDQIFIAGEPNPAEKLTELSSSGVFLGRLTPEQVAFWMRRTIAVVIPSVWYEGFPMVLAEAYSRGVPVIASRIGALRELVDDGVTGLLFDPGDPIDLAEKLSWALQNRRKMSEMGRSARLRYYTHYSAAATLRTLKRTYEALASRNASSAENGA